jgi:hypothetical protein
MKIVKTSFIKNKKHDHNAGCHSNGETGDIDHGINSVLPQIPPGDFEIIFDHIF